MVVRDPFGLCSDNYTSAVATTIVLSMGIFSMYPYRCCFLFVLSDVLATSEKLEIDSMSTLAGAEGYPSPSVSCS